MREEVFQGGHNWIYTCKNSIFW